MARLTETLAVEYSGDGIVVNAVMPGMIWTDMLTGAEGVDEPRMRARFEWAMRVFGNPPYVPAKFVLQMAERRTGSGKTFSVLTPAMFVPRMFGEIFGAGKKNPGQQILSAGERAFVADRHRFSGRCERALPETYRRLRQGRRLHSGRRVRCG